MRESAVERYLIRQIEEAGGETRKVKWIGRTRAPDRLVLMDGFACFVELKRPGKQPTVGQWSELACLAAAGLNTVFINDFLGVDQLIERAKHV